MFAALRQSNGWISAHVVPSATSTCRRRRVVVRILGVRLIRLSDWSNRLPKIASPWIFVSATATRPRPDIRPYMGSTLVQRRRGEARWLVGRLCRCLTPEWRHCARSQAAGARSASAAWRTAAARAPATAAAAARRAAAAAEQAAGMSKTAADAFVCHRRREERCT